MQYKIVVLLCFCILYQKNSNAQSAPNIAWQTTIGGSGNDYLYSLIQTIDGGCILGGYSFSEISGDKIDSNRGDYFTADYWVVKINDAGLIEWQKTIGGSGDDQLFKIANTNDGGYILAGNSKSEISGEKTENNVNNFDYWVIKLDEYGNIIWQKTFGSNGLDAIGSIIQTSDFGYLVAGRSDGSISGVKSEPSFGDVDYWILKLDSIGNIEWQNTIGGNKEDYLYSVEQTIDGGYILGGSSKSDISGDKIEAVIGVGDFWIIKIDELGNIEWQNTIGSNTKDGLSEIHENKNGFIVGGYSRGGIYGDKTEISKLSDYWVLQLDPFGQIIWQNTITAMDTDYLFALDQVYGDSFILGGYSDSNLSGNKSETSFGGFDFWVVKVDSLGNILWDKTVGGDSTDYLYTIKEASDFGYFLGGFSNSNESGNKIENSNGGYDYWIVKLSSDILPCSFPPAGLFAENITTTKAKLNWDTAPGAAKYKIQFRILGTTIWTNSNTIITNKTIMSLLPNTTYQYRVRSLCPDVAPSPWSEIATFTTLSLKQTAIVEQINISVFPNPNNGQFEIDVADFILEQNISITIKNIFGQQIFYEQFIPFQSKHKVCIEAPISNNFYLIEIRSANKIGLTQCIIDNSY